MFPNTQSRNNILYAYHVDQIAILFLANWSQKQESLKGPKKLTRAADVTVEPQFGSRAELS